MVSQITFISLRYQIHNTKISNKNNYKNVTIKRSNPLQVSRTSMSVSVLATAILNKLLSPKSYKIVKKADLAKFRKNDIRKVKKSYS
jgi:hypothetical protein